MVCLHRWPCRQRWKRAGCWWWLQWNRIWCIDVACWRIIIRMRTIRILETSRFRWSSTERKENVLQNRADHDCSCQVSTELNWTRNLKSNQAFDVVRSDSEGIPGPWWLEFERESSGPTSSALFSLALQKDRTSDQFKNDRVVSLFYFATTSVTSLYFSSVLMICVNRSSKFSIVWREELEDEPTYGNISWICPTIRIHAD